MDICILLVIILLLVLNRKQVSNYTNYIDYKKPLINCSGIHEINYNNIRKGKKTIQPFGYTDNEYLDKTRFIQTSEPLPVNPDFFI